MNIASDSNGGPPRFGSLVHQGGTRFAVWSGAAEHAWVSIFDQAGQREIDRLELQPEGDGVHALFVPALAQKTRYGFRADGPYEPQRGHWFDPDKLLVDPYAVEIDRPYVYNDKLTARRGEGGDTAALMPKAITATRHEAGPIATPVFRPGGLIYEVSTRAFTMLHPDIPEKDRGTIRALAHPAMIEHLVKLGVNAVELMPVTASIDERHLSPLGLTNAWGYNPVTFMALDPRLAPGGVVDLRETVATLRAAGIGVILDLVFNHTGESDILGPTLSLRGLDNRAYYRHDDQGKLVNDTGTGNTIACDHPIVRELVLDSLRHFVRQTGVDGFRFDLAPILGRVEGRFDAGAPLLHAMKNDPVLADRILIAEPWDIGEDGYQLGRFGAPFLEWNDKYRDDIRRLWRGDRGRIGALATRLAGSSDVFANDEVHKTRSVNFIAAHDGMTLADIVSFEHKHNEANGEQNRDGHDENLSWNNGVEGDTDKSAIIARRASDIRALLATLFASRGTVMLTAGDEFGRTQNGNNNAYAQDNAVTWLDWNGRDRTLERYVRALSAMRKAFPALGKTDFLSGRTLAGAETPDVEWLTEMGMPFDVSTWEDAARRRLVMMLGNGNEDGGRLAVLVNGEKNACKFTLPQRQNYRWEQALEGEPEATQSIQLVQERSVAFMIEQVQTPDRSNGAGNMGLGK